MTPECDHEYQLECVGDVYLTGSYVCRLCDFRISMSDEQFRKHVPSSPHYQANADKTEPERTERNSSPAVHRSRKIPPTCLLLAQIDTLIELCAIGI